MSCFDQRVHSGGNPSTVRVSGCGCGSMPPVGDSGHHTGGRCSPARDARPRCRQRKCRRKEFMTEDSQLTCSDCGQEFTFSREDQAFFQERGYSTPKRCKTCRQAKKSEQNGGGGYSRSQSQGTSVMCSACGKQTTVPFEPRGDRPVFCQDCFNARKRDGGGRGGYRQRR